MCVFVCVCMCVSLSRVGGLRERQRDQKEANFRAEERNRNKKDQKEAALRVSSHELMTLRVRVVLVNSGPEFSF